MEKGIDPCWLVELDPKYPRSKDSDNLVTSQTWTPLNETQRATVEHNINHIQTEALRQLVPTSGAYINEVRAPKLTRGVIADETGILG